MASKNTTKVHRSAITGRFVRESTAKRNPKTTVTETVIRKKRGRK
jgi:ectoine hydroxylase-related dioxygenase (phytanoyl-CoA dioxygenase family)